MLQAKLFSATGSEGLNHVLKQVPDSAFMDLKVLGDFRPMSKNHYLLLMNYPTAVEISIDPDTQSASNIYYDANGALPIV